MEDRTPEQDERAAKVAVVDAVRTFVTNLDQSLSPHLQECYSADTKALRNAVLAAGLVLILLAFGAIGLATEGGAFAGIKFEPKQKYTLQVAGAIVEGFLVVVLAVRCYVEWSGWRLKNLSPEWALLLMHQELAEGILKRLDEEKELDRQRTELVFSRGYVVERAQLSQALDDSREGDLAKRQRAMLSLIDKYLPRVQFAKRARFWLEGLFPVAFGVFAVVVSVMK